MKIAIVEPFFSGSHQRFIEELLQFSKHQYTLYTLPGKNWKWRMYGASVTLAEAFLEKKESYDLILVTDMLDLSTFLSLIRKKISHDTKVILYFHENQFEYPWSTKGDDKRLNRDVHYGMINYHSALCADEVWFNSAYNQNTFLNHLDRLLAKMPDYHHETLKSLTRKSKVMPLGIDFSKLPNARPMDYSKNRPLILWNHRMEYDKNPSLFFHMLSELKEEGEVFDLAIVGSSLSKAAALGIKELEVLEDCVVYQGYLDRDEYNQVLVKSDIMPVTSKHDFFGLSVMEAIYCGVFPILPKRMSYPEIYQPKTNPEIFYEKNQELKEKTRKSIHQFQNNKSYKELVMDYDWKKRVHLYDASFEE